MNRPDSDGQPCTEWTPGRPGDGVRVFPLGTHWQPPVAWLRDERGRPVENERYPSRLHIYRFTARADVPMLRGREMLGGCLGDGHYECKGCVFYRPPWDERVRTIEDWRDCR